MNTLSLFFAIILLSVGFVNQAGAITCLGQLEVVIDNLGEEKFFLDKIKIEDIFSKDKSYKKYQGIEGQLLFNDQVINSDRMDYVFQLVSKQLGKVRFKKLGWQEFFGSTRRFRKLRSLILDENGNVREEFVGMEGYARFADQEFSGDMNEAYFNISSVLGGVSSGLMKRLGWQGFRGSTERFRELRSLILDERGNVREEFVGMGGYACFADQEFSGDMLKTYKNISSVLGGVNSRYMKRLDWQEFYDSTEIFHKLRSLILDESGNVREGFVGMEGYARFADQEISGDMKKTYMNISSVLGGASNKLMKRLGWQAFHGSTETFRKLRNLILDENGNVREEFVGMEGCTRFADQEFSGDMFKTYQNISSVLGGAKSRSMKELGWQEFKGSTKRFRELRDIILDESGNVREEFVGMEGYTRFADQEFSGDMKKTYMNISSVLGGARSASMKELDWRMFPGSTEKFHELKNVILDENGNIRKEFIGFDGQHLLANQYFSGNTLKAYLHISPILGGAKSHYMQSLGWKAKKM